VNTSIKFDGQSTFKAVKINNPVFRAAGAAEFCTQLAAAQQASRRSLGVRWVAPRLAEALGWKVRGE
jgi:hypothetical protein